MRRVHHENALPLGPLMRWLVLVAFVGVLGLCYVHMKHKLKVDGDRCRDLEHAVEDLDEKLQVAVNEVNRLTARPALERKRQEGYIRMVQVHESSMVRLRTVPAETASLADETNGEVAP